MIRVVGRENKYDLVSAYRSVRATKIDPFLDLFLFTANSLRTIAFLTGSAYVSFSAAVYATDPLRQAIGQQPGDIASCVIAFGGAALGVLQAPRSVIQNRLHDKTKPDPVYVHSMYQTLIMAYVASAMSVAVGIEGVRSNAGSPVALPQAIEQQSLHGNNPDAPYGLSTEYSFSME